MRTSGSSVGITFTLRLPSNRSCENFPKKKENEKQSKSAGTALICEPVQCHKRLMVSNRSFTRLVKDGRTYFCKPYWTSIH